MFANKSRSKTKFLKMEKENNIVAELPNSSPASKRSFLFKNNLNSINRVAKKSFTDAKKMRFEETTLSLQKPKERSSTAYKKLLIKQDAINIADHNHTSTEAKDKAIKALKFGSVLEIMPKKRYTMFEKPVTELSYDTAEKALANFNAEKSSSAPLRSSKKQQQQEEYDSLFNHKKEDLKNEFWIGDNGKDKVANEYRPLLNWKKQQHMKNDVAIEYKPLWQQRSNSLKNNILSPLNSKGTNINKLTNSSIYTGETYNDPNIVFETTEKNKKLYDKIGGYKSSILEMKQEHNKLEMMKIPMITYELSKKEIVLNKLKDDMRFFNKDIERIKQNQVLLQEENEARLKNFKIKLDVEMNDFLTQQDKLLYEKLKEQERKQQEWRASCAEKNKDLQELNKIKMELIDGNKNLENQIHNKLLEEELELERLSEERKREVEEEKARFIETNANFVSNANLEKRKTELLLVSDLQQQENEKLKAHLQSTIQKISDERFLLSTVTDDEQMKSSELMKYGLEKMEPLEQELNELKKKWNDALLEEQKLHKGNEKLDKFIATIQKKIDSLK